MLLTRDPVTAFVTGLPVPVTRYPLLKWLLLPDFFGGNDAFNFVTMFGNYRITVRLPVTGSVTVFCGSNRFR